MSEAISRNYEIVRAGPNFEALLQIGIAACFADRQVYDDNLERIAQRPSSDPEQRRLISMLGYWGARAAFEGADRLHISVSDEPNQPSPHDLALKFGGERDQSIVDKIEAFGQTLLDEAFNCLGTDAISQAEKLANSTDETSDFEVIDWLTGRINAMQRASKDSVQDEKLTGFHPIRLSPRAIGTYPEVGINTTCLGISILTASFFERAGLKHLQAGVSVTDGQQARRDLIDMMTYAAESTSASGIDLSDITLERMARYIAELEKTLFQRRGYHATSYVKLNSGTWVQDDLNLDRIVHMPSDDTKELDDTYQQISEMADVQQGFERLTIVDYGRPVLVYGLLYADGLEHGRLASRQAIDEALLAGTMPDDVAEIARSYILPTLFGPSQKDYITSIQAEYEDITGLSNEEVLKAASDVIKQYVFYAKDDDEVSRAIARCRTDASYRQRRVEDLLAAGLPTACRLASLAANKILKRDRIYMHRGVEFGMPAYRIGAAALSDFSVYMQPLPQSFWATYWPSNTIITEHAEYDTPEKARRFLNYGMYGVSNHLNYVEGSGIIMRLLERFKIQSDERKDEHHGQAQPEEA